MLHKVECVMVECDNCKDPLDYNGYGIFVDKEAANDSLDCAEWYKDGDKHYCNKCHKIGDEDELIIDSERTKPEPYILPPFHTGVEFGESPYNGIPLTEEWLVRFGFRLNGTNKGLYFSPCGKLRYNFKLRSVTILQPCDKAGESQANDCGRGECLGDFVKIDFIHELQNLYFALTGKELKIANETTI